MKPRMTKNNELGNYFQGKQLGPNQETFPRGGRPHIYLVGFQNCYGPVVNVSLTLPLSEWKHLFWYHILIQKCIMGEGACALLRKACLQGRLLAGIWEPGFQKGSHHFLMSGLLCLTYLCKQCGSYLLLSFWESRILLCIKQRLHDQPPVKTLSTVANKLPR